MVNQRKSGAVLNYIALILNTLTAVLFTPIILKFIGQAEYGLYSMVSSVIAYFSVLDFGFGNAMIRYVSREKALKNKEEEKNINSLFLFLYLGIGIITAIAGAIVYSKIDMIFSNSLTILELEKARKMMIVLLLNVVLTFPLSIFSSYIASCEKFIFPRIVNITRMIVYPLIMYPLLLMGHKAVTLVIVVVGLNVVSMIINVYYAFAKLKMRLTFNIKKIDFSKTKEIFAYSFFVFLNLIVDTVFNNTDQVILGIVANTTAVSIYAIGNQIKTIYNSLSTSISGVFLPKLTKIISLGNKNNEVSDIFIKVSRIQLFLLTLILSGFIIFGRQFLNIWVGPDFQDSYWVVIWLIIFSTVPLSQNIGISVLQAMNKHKFRSVVYIVIAVLNVIISIPLARMYQGVGAAIGSAIATFLGQILIMNVYYKKVAKLDIITYWKNFIKIVFPILLISYGIKQIIPYEIGIIKLIIYIGIYSIVYIAYTWFVHANNYEKDLVKGMLKIRGNKK